MKFVFLLFALMAAVAYISVTEAVIPNNCVRCPTADNDILCKEPNKPNCKAYVMSNINGSTNLADYTLWRKFTCTDLQSGYDFFCVSKKVLGEPAGNEDHDMYDVSD